MFQEESFALGHGCENILYRNSLNSKNKTEPSAIGRILSSKLLVSCKDVIVGNILRGKILSNKLEEILDSIDEVLTVLNPDSIMCIMDKQTVCFPRHWKPASFSLNKCLFSSKSSVLLGIQLWKCQCVW